MTNEQQNTTIELALKGVLENKLSDGTIEKALEEQFEKGINHALNGLFGSYGDATKIIEKQIKSVMIPYLETRDYSEYIVKVDHVLTEILKATALDNKKILDNFKDLISPVDKTEINVSEIYEVWEKYVSENVETSDLEVCYDDGEPTYYDVNVSMVFEEEQKTRFFSSSMLRGVITFACEEDEELKCDIPLYGWTDLNVGKWQVDRALFEAVQIPSLKNLNDFEIYIMRLKQAGVKIVMDESDMSSEVEVEARPEAEFS